MTSLSNRIAQVESQWTYPINGFINDLYEPVHLPSHDVAHHFRVWKFCKDLLHEIERNSLSIDSSKVEQALIACLFHDTGLTIDTGEKHGFHSRVACQKFFQQNPNLTPANLNEILKAIEYHDDKTLKDLSIFNANQEVDLVNLVSTADDLDAFGLIGVYRYLEIYTLRGHSLQEIPSLVMLNLENRFTNFERMYSNYIDLVNEQKLRFLKTNDFFKSLDNHFNSPSDKEDYFLIIAEVLLENLLVKKMDTKTTIDYALKGDYPTQVKIFFECLRDELESF